MVAIAESAEAKPAGATSNPQAAAANPISVSKMARMAASVLPFSRCQPVQRAERGGRSNEFRKLCEDREKTRPRGVRPGLPVAGAGSSRHRYPLLLLGGVRGAIVVNHGEFVERIVAAQD